MPVQVSYPGVYIQEVSSGVHTITGVSTSIAAFLGRTARGPMNKAVRCLSYADFLRAFGGAHPESDLAQSVRMFFDNGGTDCYVVRLAAGAQAAKLLFTDLSGNAIPSPVRTLLATAKTPGLWGNGLRMEVDYNTSNPDESFNLAVIHTDGGKEVARETFTGLTMDPDSARFAPAFVSQSSSLIDLKLHADLAHVPPGPKDLLNAATSFAGYSQTRPFKISPIGGFRTEFETLLTTKPAFQISVDDQGYVDVTLADVLGASAPAIAPGSAWTPAQMATRIEQVLNPQLNAAISGSAVKVTWQAGAGGTAGAFRITADSGKKRSVRIRRAAANDFSVPAMLGLDQGGIEVTRFSDLRPVPTDAYLTSSDRVLDLAEVTRDLMTSIQVDGLPAIPLNFSTMSGAAGDLWITDSAGKNDGIREKLRYIAKTINDTTGLPWRAELWGYHLALRSRQGTSNKIASAVTSAGSTVLGGSNFTRNVRQYSLGNTGTSSFQIAGTPADVGIDGNAPQLAEFQGNEVDQTGFYALDPVDLFNLMVIPADAGIPESVHKTLWGPASNYCQKHRAFLLIDAPTSWTSGTRPAVVYNTALINDLRATVVKDYSAVFYPRLTYVDPSTGLARQIGPAGAMAGLMARIDTTRGVWKAPAGTEADLRGIIGLEVKLTDMENGVLNKQAVNCMRAFPSGFVSWGARTMWGSDDDGSEWKYIPIRRLALFLEESLFRGTKWVVFEPNDEPLWAKIRLNLNAFMMSLFRQGAFQGSTPDKAFFVKCDSETTTQNDRNLGIVNIEVGFAPLKPAEFVVIKIQQIAGDL